MSSSQRSPAPDSRDERMSSELPPATPRSVMSRASSQLSRSALKSPLQTPRGVVPRGDVQANPFSPRLMASSSRSRAKSPVISTHGRNTSNSADQQGSGAMRTPSDSRRSPASRVGAGGSGGSPAPPSSSPSSRPSSGSPPGTDSPSSARTPADDDMAYAGDLGSPAAYGVHQELMQEGMVWGTKVAVEPLRAHLKAFIQTYRESMTSAAERKVARFNLQEKGKPVPPELAPELDYAEMDESEEPLYTRQLQDILQTLANGGAIPGATDRFVPVTVNAKHLFAFPDEGAKLYEQVTKYPGEALMLMDMVWGAELAELAAAAGLTGDIDGEGGEEDDGLRHRFETPAVRVRVSNLMTTKKMRSLDPSDIEQLVSVRGMVIRCSAVIPDMRTGFFRCTACGQTAVVEADRGRISEPPSCEACRARQSMELVHNRCAFNDKQMVKVQETPESIAEGETPQTVVLYVYDELVDALAPGDRVVITGIFKATGMRSNPRHRTLRSVFKTHLDAIHFDKGAEAERLRHMDPSVTTSGLLTLNSFDSGNNSGSQTPGTPNRGGTPRGDGGNGRAELDFAGMAHGPNASALRTAIAARCEEMAQDPAIYAKLAASLAPSVYEMEDVKKGLLLQLFGGCNFDLGSEGRKRGEVNVLLCGDPGTSKSQLLSYVHKIAPRGMYTSGTGSSAVGLTAYITKDPDSGEPVLESGALVLSDGGVCCIDEFDKMSDATRSILHEVMEQQTVSIAKAGIIATLNARTSVLASANPVESRYNPRLSVVENLQLPPSLLSRFDLLYLILDTVSADNDRKLAQHLVSLHYNEEERDAAQAEAAAAAEAAGTGAAVYSRREVSAYISYAKEKCHPVLSDAAGVALRTAYVEMRKRGLLGVKKTITATARQLESLIRLSEAHARMHLRPVVEEEDVAEAVRLMETATQRAAVDPRTGTINMDLLTTGHSSADREAVVMVKEAVREVLASKPARARLSLQDLEKALAEAGNMDTIERSHLAEAVRELGEEPNPILLPAGRDRFTVTGAGVFDGF